MQPVKFVVFTGKLQETAASFSTLFAIKAKFHINRQNILSHNSRQIKSKPAQLLTGFNNLKLILLSVCSIKILNKHAF